MRVAILLAAGWGSRFGRSPKPLAVRDGRTLLAHALKLARAAPVGRVILVVGRQGARIAATARKIDPRIAVVHATHWRQGLPASLAAGVSALRPNEREAFVFLADMPVVPPGLAARLVRQAGAPARAMAGHRPGHPVLLDWTALQQIRTAGRFDRHRLHHLAADRRCRFDVDRRRTLNVRVPALKS